MYRLKPAIFLLIILMTVTSCEGLKESVSRLFESSARAKYERQFAGPDSLMTQWKGEYTLAGANSLEVADGFTFTAFPAANHLYAYGYSLPLTQGDDLRITVSSHNPTTKFFIDVYSLDNSDKTSESELLKNGLFAKVIERTGVYRVIIQPEIMHQGDFTVSIYTQPSLGFPVAGKGNKDAQSFWGAARDSGARRHEGIDIFAARGTPVVAVTDGYITRTGNSGLGGKQVWQRDGIFGYSYYYAHLDSIIATDGRQVKAGDTLGLVGSTGNAEGGAPHLHFGIYGSGGAVDPYPFIRKRAVPPKSEAAMPPGNSLEGGTNIRLGPGTEYGIAKTTSETSAVQVLAGNGKWYHIRLKDRSEGFVTVSGFR
ncbi:M23 family metallopeptidase [Kaistella sp. PBT33-4]|uniref:M23 family metallopeptidase n=1 Tax=Kaistella sp. PBT33-4 TaxID=3032000 RepID=UPI0023D83DCA|nr:M23 family metallopeptidase [Kaistella sp. PBT33-4]MDF0720811.1 M23 family metallopeptidase [Kaistella sp. PBT33-4]